MFGAEATKRQYYRPELDAVRFVAFLLVFLHHTLPSGKDPRVVHLLEGLAPAFDSFTDACAFGLSLFFTLSAFLICELLLRELEVSGSIGVKQFYIRRILRIWPLYYFGVALGVVAAFITGGVQGAAPKLGWFAIFMGSWLFSTQGVLHNPASALWSISVEEQFYLFAPWTVKYLSRTSLYGFCVVIIFVANAWLFHLGRTSALDHRIWFNSIVQWECFAGGILLCLGLHGRLPRIAVWQRLVLVIFSFSCWFYACYGLHTRFGSSGQQNPGSWSLIAGYGLGALSSVMILAAFMGVSPKLVPRWTVYLGRISYGLYVFHGFAFDVIQRLVMQRFVNFKSHALIRTLEGPIYLMNIMLTFGLTLLMAMLSYRYIETPFLKMKRRHVVIESQPTLESLLPDRHVAEEPINS